MPHSYYFRFPESVFEFFWLWHSYSQTEAELLSKQAKEYWKGEEQSEVLPLFEQRIENQITLSFTDQN